MVVSATGKPPRVIIVLTHSALLFLLPSHPSAPPTHLPLPPLPKMASSADHELVRCSLVTLANLSQSKDQKHKEELRKLGALHLALGQWKWHTCC